VTSLLESPNIGLLFWVLWDDPYWVLYFTLFRVSSALLVCRTASLKKDRVWWNGKETDYRKTATARQTNCPASLCESFWGNNSDGWEDERPVSGGHTLISLFSAISLFANHYPWHTLLFYPSIKMREGTETERWMHLVTCINITWCAGPQFKNITNCTINIFYQIWMILSPLDNLLEMESLITHQCCAHVVQMKQQKCPAVPGVWL